jgi:hypothetical protein
MLWWNKVDPEAPPGAQASVVEFSWSTPGELMVIHRKFSRESRTRWVLNFREGREAQRRKDDDDKSEVD